MKRTLSLALLCYALGNISYASTDCSSDVKSYKDLIVCAELRSPDIQSALLEVARAKAHMKAAGQWKNPDLSMETFQGKVGSERQSESDVALGIPIELGGKISAREAVASGNVGVTEAKLFQARAKVRSEILLKLHRLRQVLHEQEIIDEAIGTFSKLVSQYARRPGLSPEQQMSSSVFQLSKSEYDLKRSETNDELLELDAFFKLTVGLGTDVIRKTLPESPKTWPSVTGEKSNQFSPQMRVLQAELDTAQAELSLAKSETWPTLTVGPSLKLQTEAGQSNSLMGVNVSLPLPLFNLNGGARTAAAAGVTLSETRRVLGLREQELKRDQLRKVYEQSVKTLSTSLSHFEIEKRHNDVERLFSKGVVPSALVIEAHRTSLELEKTRHDRELKALEALLGLYTIDGAILETNL